MGLNKIRNDPDFKQDSAKALGLLTQHIKCRSFHLRYLSSIKVSMQRESQMSCVRQCPYAVTKMQAELILLQSFIRNNNLHDTLCAMSIIRAPATFGSGDTNYDVLFRLASKRLLFCLPDKYNKEFPIIYVERLAAIIVGGTFDSDGVKVLAPGYELALNSIITIVVKKYRAVKVIKIPCIAVRLIVAYAQFSRNVLLEQRLYD